MHTKPVSSIAIASTAKPTGNETAQQICIFVTMASALILQSTATAFWGAYTGLIAAFCFAFILAWTASQSERYFTIYAAIPIVVCCTLLCWCIISPLPNSEIEGLPATDRINYYILYNQAQLFFNTDYEIGFLTLIYIFRPFISFTTFLVFCVTVALLGYLRVMTVSSRNNYFPILLCCGLGYFAFWSGILNITRQFLAGGLVMIGISFLLTDHRFSRRAHLICSLFGMAAMSIHFSAAIVFLFQALVLVRKLDRLLLTIWILNLTIFAANFFGLSLLRPLTSRMPRFNRYDIEQASTADLLNIIKTGVGTGNRLDWAIFLLFPMLLYYGFRVARRNSRVTQDDLGGLALFYTTLTIPFYAMSFLIYADRLAYYAYMIVPLFLIIIAGSPVMRAYRPIIIVTMGGIAISQFALGWYGYTPLFWSGGLVRGT